MKRTQSIRRALANGSIWRIAVTTSIVLVGCAAPKASKTPRVSFQGIGLHRANGDLIVLQSPNIDAVQHAALKLTDADVATIKKLRTHGVTSLKCVRIALDRCEPVSPDCKSCSLWAATAAETIPKKIATFSREADGSITVTKSSEMPEGIDFASECRCD